MLVPSTHQTALVLLVVGLVCLGSWANTFKIAKWRFELYYLDFALGVLVVAIGAAFTLGTLGAELSFNDRIAVAGLRSQAFALVAGFVFSFGNMLLVAAISMVGIAISFPLTLSIAFLLGAYFEGLGSLALFAGGAILLLVTSTCSMVAARIRSASKKGTAPQVAKARRARSIKAIIAGLAGGLLIGISAPLSSSSLWGDLGLGAYAGLLMFSIGLAISTVVFGFMFMTIPLEGNRVTLGSYRTGSFGQHLAGIGGGALWAVGMLAILLAQSVPNAESVAPSLLLIFVQGAVLLAILWGLLGWKELSAAPGVVRLWILAAFISFAGSLALMALRLRA